jgi:hypothetical protein
MKRSVIFLLSVLFAAQVFSQATLHVVSPNGGENWIIGCPSLIQWMTTNTVGPVKIELYRNGVFNMTICNQVPAGMTTFTWIPPFNVIPGNNFKVKVTSLTNATTFDFSDNNFTINQGSIMIASPNGGETWVKGTMHPILWSDNLCDNVRIELWKNGIFNSVIAASVPSNGTFNWTIPNVNTLVPGNDYKVKVMSVLNAGGTTSLVYDFSDNNFTISPGQNNGPITLLLPNGGENWMIGCPNNIQWIMTTPAGQVKIELFKNDVFYMTICSQVPVGQSMYTWIPPYSIIPGSTFKVRVSVLNTAGFDFSDGNFSIIKGNITAGSPNGGETWVKGTMHPILWTDNLCDNVRIELWKSGVFNSLIAASVPSNGTFNWTVPNIATLVPGSDYKVKIMNVPVAGNTTNMVFDFSDNNFTIAAGQNNAPIAVLIPNGGENWIIGCPYLIQWITAAVPASPVRIELYKNDLFNMTICQQVPAGQNTFIWVPPITLIPGTDFKIKVTLLTGTALFDFSNGPFSINFGNITVNSPNGGEVWVKGTMHPITWTDNICDNVRVELWKGEAFHSVIASSVPSNGNFNWFIPATSTIMPGNDYKVKILSLAIAGNTSNIVYDFSNNNFSIVGNSPTDAKVQAKSIRVYPNPFNNELHVYLPDCSGEPVAIEMLSIDGCLVLSKSTGGLSTEQTIDLNTSELPHGQYLLLVKQGNNVLANRHIFLIR